MCVCVLCVCVCVCVCVCRVGEQSAFRGVPSVWSGASPPSLALNCLDATEGFLQVVPPQNGCWVLPPSCLPKMGSLYPLCAPNLGFWHSP